jgi:hypothetical protein
MAEEAPAGTPPKSAEENRLKALVDSLWSDSKLGSQVRAKAKEMFPDITTPEDTVEPAIAPLRAEAEALRNDLKAMREERAAEKAAAEEAKQQRDLQSSLESAAAQFHLNESGFDKMVARMKETGNYSDAAAAAAYVVSQTPVAPQPGPYLGPQNINLFGTAEKDERFSLLHKDAGGRFLDAEFTDFMTDPDKYVRDAGFA